MDGSRIGFFWTKILLLCLLTIYFDVCESQEDRGVRIVDGTSPRDGRVEIYRNDKWGTVSTNGWADKEAAVVCALLGFQGPAVSKTLGPVELAMDVPVYSVSCSKGGSSLADCKIETTEPEVTEGHSLDYLNGLEYYIHDQNAGVTCEDAGNNSATIVINVIGLIIAIAVIVLFCCLIYRFIRRKTAAKEGQPEGEQESIAMTESPRVRKDYTDIEVVSENIQEEGANQAEPLLGDAQYARRIEKDYADNPQFKGQYARKIEKDYADNPEDGGKSQEDEAQQYEAVKDPEADPERDYIEPIGTNDPQEA